MTGWLQKAKSGKDGKAMKWFRFLPIILLSTGLSGCYTASQLEYDALKPAEITISGDVRSITVIARCDLDSTFKQASLKSGNFGGFKRDSLMSKQMVIGCCDALVESPRFTVNNPVLRRSLAGAFKDPDMRIPWDAIRNIAGNPPQDAVLSLEYASVDDTIRFHDDDWLGYYQYYVMVSSMWRLYRLGDFQTKEYRFRDTVSFDIPSPNEFLASPDNALECIKSGMYESGARSARRLAPYWSEYQRNIFVYGPMDFLTGGTLLKEGKWRDAAEVWQKYTVSKNRMRAGKACFNMAVTSEMAGNIPAALEWIKRSENLGIPEYYIKDYQPKLIKRKSEMDKLDSQLK